MIQSEATRFVSWLAELCEDKPLFENMAYGKVFSAWQPVPKSHYGRERIHWTHAFGTVTVWPKTVVFLGRSLDLPINIRDYGLVLELMKKVSHDVSGVAATLAGGLPREHRLEQFIILALDQYSFFIPVDRIERINGGQGLFSFFLGRSLDIHYKDFQHVTVHAHICEDRDSSFSSRRMRASIERATSSQA